MLKAGQMLLLNNRLWSLRQVQPLDERNLELETIGASEASLGMTRRMKAIQYGEEIFIEQRQGSYWYAHLERDWIEGERGPVLTCQTATSLDLLAAHTRHPAVGDLKNEFSWSYSRAGRYDRCPRAYYYHYYAAWEGWRKEAPQPVRQAYLLKNLTDLRYLWVGALVHETIKFAMARLKAGQPVAQDDLIKHLHRRAQTDFDDSQTGRYRHNPQQPSVGFQEHYYQTDLSKTTWQTALVKAEGYIRTFINSTLYARLQGQPAASFLNVETLQSFSIADTKVWVQMDLARYEDNTIYLYDWKTGQIDEPAVRQQLGIYGLYVRQAWPEWATAPIQGIVFALAEDRLVEFDLTEADLQATQATIEASIAQLKGFLIDPETNLAEMRRFPMTDNLQICRGCQFRELCGR